MSGTLVNPNVPSLADFTTFVYNQGVPSVALPSDSQYLQWSFGYASNVTISDPNIPGVIYTIALYNLGMHHLLTIAQDQPGQTFFANARAEYILLLFSPGVVLASGDQGTSQTLLVPDFYRTLTLTAQRLLKTPWGMAYLEYTQMYGPTVVGYS